MVGGQRGERRPVVAAGVHVDDIAGLALFLVSEAANQVNGAAWSTERVSWIGGVFDRLAVDGLVTLVSQVVYTLGDWGRQLQTGKLQ